MANDYADQLMAVVSAGVSEVADLKLKAEEEDPNLVPNPIKAQRARALAERAAILALRPANGPIRDQHLPDTGILNGGWVGTPTVEVHGTNPGNPVTWDYNVRVTRAIHIDVLRRLLRGVTTLVTTMDRNQDQYYRTEYYGEVDARGVVIDNIRIEDLQHPRAERRAETRPIPGLAPLGMDQLEAVNRAILEANPGGTPFAIEQQRVDQGTGSEPAPF